MPRAEQRKRPAQTVSTEAEMLGLLRRKLSADDSGVGSPSHSLIEHVRSDAGFGRGGTVRTIDAISLGMWPSRGLLLTGYEVKCSRADWLTELKKPEKAETFTPYLDRFYLVISQESFVQPGELPAGWGMMAKRGNTLVTVKEAPPLPDPLPLDRGLLVGMMRQAVIVANTPPQEIEEARRAGFEEGRKLGEDLVASDRDFELTRLRERVNALEEIEKVLGMRVTGTGMFGAGNVQQFAEAFKTAMSAEHDLDRLRSRLERVVRDAETLGSQAKRMFKEHGFERQAWESD